MSASSASSGAGAGGGGSLSHVLFMDGLPRDFQTNTQLAMLGSLLDDESDEKKPKPPVTTTPAYTAAAAAVGAGPSRRRRSAHLNAFMRPFLPTRARTAAAAAATASAAPTAITIRAISEDDFDLPWNRATNRVRNSDLNASSASAASASSSAAAAASAVGGLVSSVLTRANSDPNALAAASAALTTAINRLPYAQSGGGALPARRSARHARHHLPAVARGAIPPATATGGGTAADDTALDLVSSGRPLRHFGGRTADDKARQSFARSELRQHSSSVMERQRTTRRRRSAPLPLPLLDSTSTATAGATLTELIPTGPRVDLLANATTGGSGDTKSSSDMSGGFTGFRLPKLSAAPAPAAASSSASFAPAAAAGMNDGPKPFVIAPLASSSAAAAAAAGGDDDDTSVGAAAIFLKLWKL